MSVLEKIAQRYMQDSLSEKEIELAEAEKKIQKHFAKSRAYREKLHAYYRLLSERDVSLNQKEEELSKKSAELEEREENFYLKIKNSENELSEKQKLIFQEVKENVIKSLESERAKTKEEVSRLKKEIKSLETQKEGLQNAEYRIIDWAVRVDNKERSIYEKISSDVEKFQKFKISINGYDFESYVADLLVKNGYQQVNVTQKSRDYGADVIAEKDGVKYVFQCKYYSSQVGIEAVQQVYSAKTHYDAHVAVAVTNSVFTTAAKILAEELKVILWDCEYLSVLEKKDIKYAEAKNG